MHIPWIFLKKGRNCEANLLKKWTFDNLWNHFEALLHKVSREFMIIAFHDFPPGTKNHEMRGLPVVQ